MEENSGILFTGFAAILIIMGFYMNKYVKFISPLDINMYRD
jgi:hypothetical protein